jgi:coenzyme F420-reducing hydrogenase delta subunit
MGNLKASTEEFEPIVLGLACNWCGYAAADQAGMAKIQYPTNIKLARVMCLGTVDPCLVMNAFTKGFDGVILVGCHIGECHYVSGNKNALLVVERIRKILALIGLQEGRLRIEEVSAGEAPKFAKVVKEFIGQLKVLGPSPLRKTEAASGSEKGGGNRAMPVSHPIPTPPRDKE